MLEPEFYRIAKNAEKNNDWETAKKYWGLYGSKIDVDACQMIIDATAIGDEFRRLNHSCPVCCVVSLKSEQFCPRCKVDKEIARETFRPLFG